MACAFLFGFDFCLEMEQLEGEVARLKLDDVKVVPKRPICYISSEDDEDNEDLSLAIERIDRMFQQEENNFKRKWSTDRLYSPVIPKKICV